MSRFARRACIGAAAGGCAGIALAFVLQSPWFILLGMALGAGYAVTIRPLAGSGVDSLMAAASLGIPAWALFSVIAAPIASGRMQSWEPESIRALFPALVGWIIYGSALGLLVQAFSDLAARLAGPEAEPVAPPPIEKKRVVILGGGFAGMGTAECLEKQFFGDDSVSITLVSETNALLFTPMLAEVAGGSLDPGHISTPLRSSLHRTEFIRGRVQRIDVDRRIVEVGDRSSGSSGLYAREVPYDHLVLALGAISNYLGMANVEKLAFNFKSLLDAIRIRNHIIEMIERADREPDVATRAPLLTFVIAGGGFAGVELAGSVNDFAHGILADYPNLRAEELRTVLVHGRDVILPELSESLGRYAQRRMAERGVTFRLNTRLKDVEPGRVILSDGDVPSATLVWTAGTAPNPLVKTLPVETDKRGAVRVESTFAVPGHLGLWALGDCASVNDAKTGLPCPPTAQFAIRQAAVLAKNIRAAIAGKPLQGFHFDSLGALCVVGHQTACAEISVPFVKGGKMRFSGLLAWLMWRAIYLGKLPGFERKIRVMINWTIELFFPRDIVQTIDLKD
jgi:NADH dehydrogenase